MKPKLFFFLPLILLCLAACDREEFLLVTEVELPREATIVEEEELFLRQNLDDYSLIDTTGSVIYSEESGWFYLINSRAESYSCTISEGRFSARGNGNVVPGGNEEGIIFHFLGRTPDPTQPFESFFFAYFIPDENGVLRTFGANCGATLSAVVTSITEDRIKGILTGEIIWANEQGVYLPCDDPDFELRTVNIEFNLPRQYCE